MTQTSPFLSHLQDDNEGDEPDEDEIIDEEEGQENSDEDEQDQDSKEEEWKVGSTRLARRA